MQIVKTHPLMKQAACANNTTKDCKGTTNANHCVFSEAVVYRVLRITVSTRHSGDVQHLKFLKNSTELEA